MQIRNTDKRREPEPDTRTAKEKLDDAYPDGRWHTGRPSDFDEAVLKPPHLGKYDISPETKAKQSERISKAKLRRKQQRQQKYKQENGHKRKISSTREANPHTVWIRKDIWAAVEIYKDKHERSYRSVLEEALYRFLIQEKQVPEAEDLGMDPEITSWVTKE